MVRNSARLALIGTAIACLPILLLHGPGIFAAQEVISDDGREVLLKDDGTWEFRSNDRYANTPDGRRVRLKQDSTWEYVGNAPLTTNTQARTETTDIHLQRAVVEIYQEPVYKNIRTETQTVFYLQVALSPLADASVAIDKGVLARIKVTDNEGTPYPILSLTPDQTTLAPNSQMAFAVRVKGSPSWLKSIKSMKLELAPGVFGNRDSVTLTMTVHEMEREVVAALPEFPEPGR